MKNNNNLPYWMVLCHLPKWKNAQINRLVIKILEKISFDDFFSLNDKELTSEFDLTPSQIQDIKKAKSELANYSFLAENLIDQGFQIIPINSPLYSETLKNNLKTYAPPLLYVKGNTNLLNQKSAAIVGSRKASTVSLEFTKSIAHTCSKNDDIVVSGFAKGVDKTALDATLRYNGRSIVVLPQGILTFGSGIKKYYKKIIDGHVLILSTFHPKTPWSVGLAMTRNTYIYGLAKTIYVAESDNKGGTWNGAVNGLKKKRQVFIRNPEPDEKNANNLLIMQGAIPVDISGKPVQVQKIYIEDKLKTILSKGELTAKAIHKQLDMDIDQQNLQQFLSNLPFIESKWVKNKKYYFLKNMIPEQTDLFRHQV